MLLLCFIWGIEIVNATLNHRLNVYAIYPRDTASWLGVLYSPFLHGSYSHLLSNSAPFVVMSLLILRKGIREYFVVTSFIIVLGGIGVWLIGRPSFHVGLSGVIFGYFSFIMWSALVEKTLGSIVAAFLVLFLYGGLLWGLVPQLGFISWESHLMGFIAGIVVARYRNVKTR